MSSPVHTSVIVPSYNRPAQLERCLAALVQQQDAAPFEIVVTDDGSPTPLAETCARFAPRVRCIRQKNAGPGAARNAAVQAARGALLAFIDDDCLPRPGWLRSLREAHGGVERRIVGGEIANGRPQDLFATASQDLADYIYAYFDAEHGNAQFFTTNNMACSRAEFLRLGGFDPSFGKAGAEDRDFCMRWRDDGGDLVFCREAVVDHHHEMSLREFLRQHANYGRGALHLHRAMTARGSATPKVQPLRFYLDLLTWPVRRGGLSRLPVSVLMGLSQVAMVAGYAHERYVVPTPARVSGR